jgi:hypothetical protein
MLPRCSSLIRRMRVINWNSPSLTSAPSWLASGNVAQDLVESRYQHAHRSIGEGGAILSASLKGRQANVGVTPPYFARSYLSLETDALQNATAAPNATDPCATLFGKVAQGSVTLTRDPALACVAARPLCHFCSRRGASGTPGTPRKRQSQIGVLGASRTNPNFRRSEPKSHGN